MGILDDAIREHLDLKRRLGAADDELKQLEDEAFGPPARPGDPDFPESEPATNGEAADAQLAEAPSEEARVVEEPTRGVETQTDPDPTQDEAATEEPLSDELPVQDEPPAAEHEVLTGEHTEEAMAPTPVFDQSLQDELDLDLDLEDEELPSLDEEVPVEGMETEEHPMEEELAADEELEHEPATPSPAPQAEVAPAEPFTDEEDELDDEDFEEDDELDEGEGEDEEESDDDESDEDVLADTPEFLRDAPEDDELWFEQGKPKDFDFD